MNQFLEQHRPANPALAADELPAERPLEQSESDEKPWPPAECSAAERSRQSEETAEHEAELSPEEPGGEPAGLSLPEPPVEELLRQPLGQPSEALAEGPPLDDEPAGSSLTWLFPFRKEPNSG